MLCAALAEKLSDIKLKGPAGDCLLDFTEATCPQFVFSQLYQYTAGHKNPKVTSEALLWMVKALEDFGTASIGIPPFCSSPFLPTLQQNLFHSRRY